MTVFINGTILPVDAAFSEHAALAIADNKVVAVGSRDDVLAVVGRGAKTVDLAGRVLLPGFIEPHMHFALLAGLGHLEDIGPFRRPTFDDALSALRDIAAAAGPDEWVMARQFDPIMLDPPRDLTTRELDAIAPDRPAFILNASGHVAYVNSRALALDGITRDSEDPPGGEYGRYEDGTPNGVLYGQSASSGILYRNQQIADRMQSGFVPAGRQVGDQAAALGITTLCDQATGGLAGPVELDSYRAMYDGGSMKARIRAYAYSEQPGWDEAGVQAGQGDALMRVAGWKIVTDGSNQGFTGRQREPYYTRDTVGIFYVEPDALREMAIDRSQRGWPLSLHGNGDAAIDQFLDAWEAALEACPAEDARPILVHAQMSRPEQLERMQKLGVSPSFFSAHVYFWGDRHRDIFLGPERAARISPAASAAALGLPFTTHLDTPIVPIDSMLQLWTPVVRETSSAQALGPEERVSVEQALRAMTYDAAWQLRLERDIGSIEPGKQADLVILSANPLQDDIDLRAIQIERTLVGGVTIYQKPD